MENRINSINTLVSAFEARNEQLHEEIKKNEEAIEEMKAELSSIINENALFDINEESKLKMVA